MRVFVGILYFVAFNALAVPPSADIPVDSNIYDRMERWAWAKCALPYVESIRPAGYLEYYRRLHELENPEQCKPFAWLVREAQKMGRPQLPNFASARLSLLREEIELLGIEARISPLDPQRAGRVFPNGAGLFGEGLASGGFGKDGGLAVSVRPGWFGVLDGYQSIVGKFYLYEGYLKVGYKQAEFTVGREQLVFGEARHGSLLLSSGTAPLEQIRFTVRPHVLPEPFSFFGPLGFQMFWARSGEVTEFVKNASYWGVQLAMRPHPNFEVAFLHLILYGGDGRPGLELGDYFKNFFFVGSDLLDVKQDRLISPYFSWMLPSLGLKLYAQGLFRQFTRSSNWFSEDLSLLLGVWVPRLWRLSWRLEFVRTARSAYRSALWPQGFTYQKTPMGHSLGPDGDGVYLDVGFYEILGVRPTLNLNYEHRGRSLSGPILSPETRFGPGIGVLKQWIQTELQVDLNSNYVKNGNNILADDYFAVSFAAKLTYSFL